MIEGNIRASADIHVDGNVEGDIHCAELIQGPTSRITGHIQADAVRLAGAVEGSVHAGQLVIEASARIMGDCFYTGITIEQGAHIDGRLSHAADPADNTGAASEIKLIATKKDAGSAA